MDRWEYLTFFDYGSAHFLWGSRRRDRLLTTLIIGIFFLVGIRSAPCGTVLHISGLYPIRIRRRETDPGNKHRPSLQDQAPKTSSPPTPDRSQNLRAFGGESWLGCPLKLRLWSSRRKTESKIVNRVGCRPTLGGEIGHENADVYVHGSEKKNRYCDFSKRFSDRKRSSFCLLTVNPFRRNLFLNKLQLE